MYGMNFIQPNGDPGLPELMWWPGEDGATVSGYGYFWLLCGSCIVFTLFLYMLAGLLPSPIPDWFVDWCVGCWNTMRGAGQTEAPATVVRKAPRRGSAYSSTVESSGVDQQRSAEYTAVM